MNSLMITCAGVVTVSSGRKAMRRNKRFTEAFVGKLYKSRLEACRPTAGLKQIMSKNSSGSGPWLGRRCISASQLRALDKPPLFMSHAAGVEKKIITGDGLVMGGDGWRCLRPVETLKP